MTDPIVSVIVATYERPHVLRYALRSALLQSFGSFEVLVIGDKCSESTAEVIAELDDPRVVYVNRTVNCGDQSGPNNDGVALARGKYLAFLNHDDLWLSDHLVKSVSALESHRADLVFACGLSVINQTTRLLGVLPPHGWDIAVPATLWVLRTELARAVGPWRSGVDVRGAPSQEWLHRARRSGAVVREAGHLGAVIIPSGARHNSYLDTDTSAHEQWWAKITAGDRAAERLLAEHAIAVERTVNQPRVAVRRVIRSMWSVGTQALGLDPMNTYLRLRFPRKGTYIRRLRTIRGLEAR